MYCTKPVKPGERTRRVNSPGLTKLSAIHFFVLHLSVVFLLLHAILWYYPLKSGNLNPLLGHHRFKIVGSCAVHKNRPTSNSNVCAFVIAAYWNQIYQSSWNFAENFCELRGIPRELRGKFREKSPKYCVILKKFRTNFKVLHGCNPKTFPLSAK